MLQNYEQVHVTPFGCRTPRMGPEEDDSQRVEAFHDAVHHDRYERFQGSNLHISLPASSKHIVAAAYPEITNSRNGFREYFGLYGYPLGIIGMRQGCTWHPGCVTVPYIFVRGMGMYSNLAPFSLR